MRMLVIVATTLLLSAGDGLAPGDGSSVPDELVGLLAPIALYPDQLLAQILLCASSPPRVSELSAWLAANHAVKGSNLQDAAVLAGFEPSFVALVLFPDVVKAMAVKIDWTTRLGRAFAGD